MFRAVHGFGAALDVAGVIGVYRRRGVATGGQARHWLGVTVGTSAAGALAWLQHIAPIHPFQVAALVVVSGLAWVALNARRR